MTRCNVCQEMIKRNEMDEHLKECNLNIDCSYCSLPIQKNDIKNHEAKCYYRPQQCSICKLEFQKKFLDEHFQTCSNRTKRCIYCNSNIKLIDYSQHEPVCQVEQQNLQQCMNCFKKVNKNEIHTEGLCKMCWVKEKKFSKPIRINKKTRYNLESPEQNKKCYICMKQVSQYEYQSHLASCKQRESQKYRSHIKTELTPKVNQFKCHICQKKVKETEYQNHVDNCYQKKYKQKAQINKVKCHICKKKVTQSEYDTHINNCYQKKYDQRAQMNKAYSDVNVQKKIKKKMCAECKSNDVDQYTNELKHYSFCPTQKQKKQKKYPIYSQKKPQTQYKSSFDYMNQKFKDLDMKQKKTPSQLSEYERIKRKKRKEEDARLARQKMEEEDAKLARQLMEQEQNPAQQNQEPNYYQYLGDFDEDEALAKALADSEKYKQVQ